MTDGSRSLRWRAALTVAGAAFFLMYLFGTGRLGTYIVQVDYSWTGDYLDSAQVEIDGEVVGYLELVGRQRITGFRVEPGEHVVRIVHDKCEGLAETVSLGPGVDETRFQILMADISEGSRCQIFLR